MGTLYENILGLCKEKGVKGGRMCVELGISKSIMTKLKNDPERTISTETAQKIADYFDVSVDRVLGKKQKEKPTVLSDDELDENKARLVQLVRDCPEDQAARLLQIMQLFLDSERQEH